MEYISKSLEETDKIALRFYKTIRRQKQKTAFVVGLRGDLGSGKTTFMKSFAKSLGVKEVVTSPTFVILKKYPISHAVFNTLIHIDAYRLEGGKDMSSLGWSGLLSDPKNLIFIEWPEIISDSMPTHTVYINFKFIDESTRKISW